MNTAAGLGHFNVDVTVEMNAETIINIFRQAVGIWVRLVF